MKHNLISQEVLMMFT